jgi:hypothetical protein
MIEAMRRQGKRRKQLLGDLKYKDRILEIETSRTMSHCGELAMGLSQERLWAQNSRYVPWQQH